MKPKSDYILMRNALDILVKKYQVRIVQPFTFSSPTPQ